MLHEIKSNSELFNSKLIELAPKQNDMSSNFYTVLIGNNGTGKSTLLNEIVRKYKKSDSYNSPRKVISISSSISDKFPMDVTFRRNNRDKKVCYSDLSYVYLGLRARNNQFSASAQFKKALEILVQSYGTERYSKGYRHIFHYLDYQPIIKAEYKLNISFRLLGDRIKEDNLVEYIYQKQTFYKSDYKKLLIEYNISLPEIVNFLNRYYYDKESSIIFNFSEKNIDRMFYDKSIYFESVYNYKILQVLQKLNLVRNFNVKIFKKHGAEVNFKDASSGEIAILSSLFALIPLAVDNSLILIDEPEISLHPYWQAQYIPLLDKILEGLTGCHIIIATHSHLMLSDLPIGNSSIVSFIRNGAYVQTELLSDSTYGWSAEDILLNVFQVPTTRNYYLSEVVSEALILIKDNQTSTSRYKTIIRKLKTLLPLIKDEDPLRDIIASIIEVGK